MEVSSDEDRLEKKEVGCLPVVISALFPPFLSGFCASTGAFDVFAASEDGGGGDRRICQGGG